MSTGQASVLFLVVAVALMVWYDRKTTKWLKKKKFYRYRLEDIQTVPIVPGETFFSLLPGQEFVMGREYRVRRTDGSTVVLKMTLWMGMTPIWVTNRIKPPPKP